MNAETLIDTAVEAQGQNPALTENTFEHGNDRKTWIGEQFVHRTRLGREIPCIALQGRTGSPDYYEYVPAYTRGDGVEVRSRFTTHLLVDLQNIPEDMVTIEDTKDYKSFRVNFWGEEADKAKTVLMESRQTALILIKQGSLSTYQDLYGEPRFSINVNFRGQYSVIEVQKYEEQKSFDDWMDAAFNSDSATDAPF